VALNDITREAVLQAIGEYDSLGQDRFLERYGFDRARQYLLSTTASATTRRRSSARLMGSSRRSVR
jgi:hypothetical protein